MKRFSVVGVALIAAGAMVLSVGCAQQQKKSKKVSGLKAIHFDFEKSNIKPEFEPVLQQNADWMQSNSKKNVRVEGNCDERGSIEYNIALGDRRAKSGANYLTNLGVAASRLSTISYGKERPTCTEHNESCWWQNRRDDFVTN